MMYDCGIVVSVERRGQATRLGQFALGLKVVDVC